MGGWVWPCEVHDTDGTALIHDSDGSSPGLRSLHVGYHRYCTSLLLRADKLLPAFAKSARTLKCVDGTFEVYNGGWWYQHDMVTETDGHGADTVNRMRCCWTTWLGTAISVGINQAGASKPSHKTTGSDSFPITLAPFLNSGLWAVLQPTYGLWFCIEALMDTV